MPKNLFIWFLLLPVLCFAQDQTAEYNLTLPEFIPYNTQFEVSLVTTNLRDEADILQLQISLSERLHLLGADIKLRGNDRPLRFTTEDGIHNIEIDLNELNIHPGSFFQVIFQLKPEGIAATVIDIKGIYFSGEEIKGYLGRIDEPISAEVNFYRTNRTAGKCLEVKGREYFNLKNIHRGVERLSAEFWLKFNSPGINFLKITNLSGASEIKFRLNNSQVLEIDSDNPSIENFPVFISKKTWNHFAVVMSAPEGKTKIYCNDVPVAAYRTGNANAAGVTFNFNNDSPGSFFMDLFRLISRNDDGQMRFRDRNYLTYVSPEGKLLEQIAFDDISEFRGLSDHLEFNTQALVRSDAPIFPRAPELNVKILSHSFLLEWSGGDYKQADRYIVEKSDGHPYRELSIITADNDNEKNYSYIDNKDVSSDIIYYRIKQVNKDGSYVYSPEVKIGQGTFEPFTLEQNFPNPFNPKTSIEVELLIDTEVDIVVYNLEGSEVARLYKGMLTKGVHKFSFDAEGLPSGIYLYKISTPEYSQTRKMILAK